MKIALAQINPIIGDITGNKAKIIDRYRQGQKDNVDLVIFPELALPGYPPQDFLEKREFRERVISASKEMASLTDKTALLFGSITEENDAVGTGLYNSALLCYNGEVRFIQHKSLIPNYDVFDEVRYFEPAKDVFIHEFEGEKLGISICEDIWNDKDYWKNRRYNCDPIEILKEKGATVYLNLSASPYAYGRRAERSEMLSVIAKTDKIPLIYCCCTGAQTDLIFDGGSMCFNSKGKLVQIGKIYCEDYFVFDTNKEGFTVSSVEGSYEKEVHDALIYGLKDYAQKTGFKKALVGLSGGIDSAIVTYFAAEAFGAENVDVVMMPSKYSSEGSVKDSEKLVDKLGIRSANISIQPVFDKVLNQLNPLFAGLSENVAEENIQSRIRGIYLMAISNKFGSLLCTTGNKSEMAVGYATLYGDMNGALGVIADVYKTKVYDLCRYINREEEIIPVEIIEKAPSAELKPDQKDEDSLPPYNLLDKILKMYLEENKELKEITSIIKEYDVVERILKLVDLSEFKRKQAAPVLRISKKAFGYGRRFPIVQSWKRK